MVTDGLNYDDWEEKAPEGKDKVWPTDEGVVLSREVASKPANTTMIIMEIFTYIINITMTTFPNITFITFNFSLPSLLASLVFPLDPSFDPLDSFVGLVLDPPP